MKMLFFVLTCFISSIGFAQNNHILKTEDGRRVLLKADFTWEYTDSDAPSIQSAIESTNCNLSPNFKEPELDNKIQSQLKKGRATIDDIKSKVAKDYNCTEAEVVLLSFSEKKATGIYHFCANGTEVSYKRNGHSIMKNGKFF